MARFLLHIITWSIWVFWEVDGQALAFTLLNTGRGLDKNNIDIIIAADDCSNAGITTQRFRELVEDAADDYWNGVASADLKLKTQDVGSAIIGSMSHQDIFLAGLVPRHKIFMACSQDMFAQNSSTLGSTQMDCDGKKCSSVILINATENSPFANLSQRDMSTTLAHEIGHAIGLGHSEYSHSLMYYRIGGKTQNWLGEDDIDGVSYLYPHRALGCDTLPLLGSFGGTLKELKKREDRTIFGNFFSFLGGALGALLITPLLIGLLAQGLKLFSIKMKNSFLILILGGKIHRTLPNSKNISHRF